MSCGLWANVASGAVGGVLALGGSALLHSLRTRQEAKRLEARRTAGRERRIRRLYLLWLAQFESLVGVGFSAINSSHDIDECQGMILDFYIVTTKNEDGVVVVWGSVGVLRLRYRNLALRFEHGAPLALAALDECARGYWDEWQRRVPGSERKEDDE